MKSPDCRYRLVSTFRQVQGPAARGETNAVHQFYTEFAEYNWESQRSGLQQVANFGIVCGCIWCLVIAGQRMVAELERPVERSSTSLLPSEQRILSSLNELTDYYKSRGLVGESLHEMDLAFTCAIANYRFRPPDGKLLAER